LEVNSDNFYPQYLTTGVVARHCGVSKVTVLRWIEKGNLIAFRLPGGQNRIHRDDFYAFAEKHKIPLRNIPVNNQALKRFDT
jgi:excisionase family DNA binding protein